MTLGVRHSDAMEPASLLRWCAGKCSPHTGVISDDSDSGTRSEMTPERILSLRKARKNYPAVAVSRLSGHTPDHVDVNVSPARDDTRYESVRNLKLPDEATTRQMDHIRKSIVPACKHCVADNRSLCEWA